MRQIILDTETTGLRPEAGHRIIEIGCLELVNRRLTGDAFHQYINPEREIDAGAQAVHGITNKFLSDKPIFSDVVADFVQYIDGAELIIHNAPFDVGFIDAELKRFGKTYRIINEYCSVVDTLAMARHKHPGQKNSLDALCRRYEVDNSNRELHGALLDAELLAQVYLLMTGGQTGFFDQELTQESQPVSREEKATLRNKSFPKTPVIQPTDSESKQHEAFLEILEGN